MKRRVLGIDPGSRITGYGIVEEINHQLIPVTYGVCTLTHILEFPKRLKEIYERIDDLIHQYKATEMAIENIFYAKNVKSAVKLGHARGAAMIAAAKYDLNVSEYDATQIKQAVVGYGRSSKEQIQKMVFTILGIREELAYDATDALAVAICHLNTQRYKEVVDRHDWMLKR